MNALLFVRGEHDLLDARGRVRTLFFVRVCSLFVLGILEREMPSMVPTPGNAWPRVGEVVWLTKPIQWVMQPPTL